MNCERFRERRVLDAYGELDDASGEYAEHLEQCEKCREEIEEMREISEQYRYFARERMSQSVRAPKRQWWIPAAAAAILVVALSAALIGSIPKAERIRMPSISVPSSKLSAWDADDADIDRRLHELRRGVEHLERELHGRNG